MKNFQATFVHHGELQQEKPQKHAIKLHNAHYQKVSRGIYPYHKGTIVTPLNMSTGQRKHHTRANYKRRPALKD